MQVCEEADRTWGFDRFHGDVEQGRGRGRGRFWKSSEAAEQCGVRLLRLVAYFSKMSLPAMPAVPAVPACTLN